MAGKRSSQFGFTSSLIPHVPRRRDTQQTLHWRLNFNAIIFSCGGAGSNLRWCGESHSAASCPALGGAPSNPGWCGESWWWTSERIIHMSADYWVARLKRAMTARTVAPSALKLRRASRPLAHQSPVVSSLRQSSPWSRPRQLRSSPTRRDRSGYWCRFLPAAHPTSSHA